VVLLEGGETFEGWGPGGRFLVIGASALKKGLGGPGPLLILFCSLAIGEHLFVGWMVLEIEP
jgi:hypothetical protein